MVVGFGVTRLWVDCKKAQDNLLIAVSCLPPH